MNCVKVSVGSGGSIVTVNPQESTGGGSSAVVGTAGQSAVQVTVDVPIGKAVPGIGAQENVSTGVFGTVGRSQIIGTGKASSDWLVTGGGQARSGGVTVTENEQVVASSSWSAIQVTPELPSPNTAPEAGTQAPLSTGTPPTVGSPKPTDTGNASPDPR